MSCVFFSSAAAAFVLRHLLPFFQVFVLLILSTSLQRTSQNRPLTKMDTVFQFQKSLDNKIAELESRKSANGVQGDSPKNEEDIFESVGKKLPAFVVFSSQTTLFAQNH